MGGELAMKLAGLSVVALLQSGGDLYPRLIDFAVLA
jgi:hypothetical protein